MENAGCNHGSSFNNNQGWNRATWVIPLCITYARLPPSSVQCHGQIPGNQLLWPALLACGHSYMKVQNIYMLKNTLKSMDPKWRSPSYWYFHCKLEITYKYKYLVSRTLSHCNKVFLFANERMELLALFVDFHLLSLRQAVTEEIWSLGASLC